MSVMLAPRGTHGGEGLVARRVDERHALLAHLNHPRRGVLRDAARFARGHVGRADAVEQARLAVVDVAEDRNHRRPVPQVGRVLLASVEFRQKLLFQRLFLGDLKLDAKFQRNRPGGIRVERLVDRREHPLLHQLGDDIVALDAQCRRQRFDGDRLLDQDRLAQLDRSLGLNVVPSLGFVQVAVEHGAVPAGAREAQVSFLEVLLGEVAKFSIASPRRPSSPRRRFERLRPLLAAAFFLFSSSSSSETFTPRPAIGRAWLKAGPPSLGPPGVGRRRGAGRLSGFSSRTTRGP